ncbi:MAG: hypothetical protein COW79_16125, partial [Bdellovibrionales bacterium CG22_combo_CG10-13_8_21_14_all_38_13]
MINYIDQQKLIAKLHNAIKNSNKPVVFWLGAGIGKWAGYPLWGELADEMHSIYLSQETKYKKDRASSLLKTKSYPDFFEYCKTINEKAYNNFLNAVLSIQESGPVFKKFCEILTRIKNPYVITTNVDESLEQRVGNIKVLQKENIELVRKCISEEESFLLKLHGTVSNVKSLVFTSKEYKELIQDSSYLEELRSIFSSAIVVFLGYSLQDQYILELISKTGSLKATFGQGPHFAFIPADVDMKVSEDVLQVCYLTDAFADHRGSLQAINLVENAIKERENKVLSTSSENYEQKKGSTESIYYLSDIVSYGTWQTSQTFGIKGDEDKEFEVVIGQGFSNEELPKKVRTSLHDLVVGLLCFDKVYIRLSSLQHLSALLSEDIFNAIIKDAAVRLLHLESQPAILYENSNSLLSISNFSIVAGSRIEEQKHRSAEEIIRGDVKALPGKEKEAESDIKRIISNTISISREVLGPSADVVRSGLCYPHVREMLGMSQGVAIPNLPRWLQFPVLRYANIVLDSFVCNHLEIDACKLSFGGEIMADAAFLSPTGKSFKADDMASYVVTGQFGVNLDSLIRSNPSLIYNILKYRDTQVGVSLRKDIKQLLQDNKGSE